MDEVQEKTMYIVPPTLIVIKSEKPYFIKVLSKNFDLPPIANRGVINT